LLLALAKHCNGRQLNVMAVVMRYSYGFQKKKALLTVSEIASHLGTSRRSTRRIIQELEARNMLAVIDRPGHHKKAYLVQKDWREWGGPAAGHQEATKARRAGPVRVVRQGDEFKVVQD